MLRIQERPYHRELIACLALMMGIAGGAAFALARDQPLAGGHNGGIKDGTVAGASITAPKNKTTNGATATSDAQRTASPAASTTNTPTGGSGTSSMGSASSVYSSTTGTLVPLGGRGAGGSTSSTSTNEPCICEEVSDATSSATESGFTLTDPITTALSPTLDTVTNTLP